jgi:hypothetical protein
VFLEVHLDIADPMSNGERMEEVRRKWPVMEALFRGLASALAY